MILMGVVNLTPDSFRPETRALSPEGVVMRDVLEARVAGLLRRGCSIIDFGAVSTRPGAADVPVEEEWARLEAALLALGRGELGTAAGATLASTELSQAAGASAGRGGLPAISIDTTSAEIVRRAYQQIGPFIVNDISAGHDDPAMLSTVAELGLPYIAMHKRGNPRSMDSLTEYPQGIVQAVDQYFTDFAAEAERLDIREWILDPGFGFAKTDAQNWELLSALPALRHFRRPILVGVADKRFTRTPNPYGPCQDAELLATLRGCDILRVH